MATSAPNVEAVIATSSSMGARILRADTSPVGTQPSIRNPLPHHTSMETSEEIPCLEGFMESSAADADDFSSNSVNPCTFRAPLISTMLKKKKKMLSVCRNGFPSRQNGKSSSREVKFCKLRQGLFKKAQELSARCSAEVAAIIFAPSGEVSEFASSSMSHILERFQSFRPQVASNNALLQDVKRWKCGAILQTNGIESLQDFQSMPLSINEVQSVESMLTHALDKIHRRKMELLEVETQKIIEKGEFLGKENNMLKEKLIQIMSTKESVSNALRGFENLHYLQDSLNTNLQYGLDVLQCNQEEDSFSSKN